ncbi:MAG: alpha/beta hydrolase [Xenococcaceae cyanobacterium MO_167.B52]|nr:alpha/beta hydrolase [Xenococcaceae cyanobacterium MO_167.B52]
MFEITLLNLGEIWQFSWLFPLLLSIFGFFLSLWIVIPAPTFSLLPLGVGSSEISPWLIALNGTTLLLIIIIHNYWLLTLSLMASLVGLILSFLPVSQLPQTNNQFATEMNNSLGSGYLQRIPPDLHSKMRPQPFIIPDVFRGISHREVRIERGITFASPDQVSLKLNLYQPKKKGKYPGLMILYGGAWTAGSPNSYEKFSCYMAGQGYSVIAIDYRHAPQYKFPAQIEDVEAAWQYIQDHGDKWGVDLERMAVIGRSAGGHLATLAAYKDNGIPFRAVVNYYAPTDLIAGYYDPPFPNPIRTHTILHKFLGGTPEELPALYKQASLNSYIRPILPPSLLIYGSRDHIVKAKFGRQFYSQLREASNLAVWLEIPWAEHAFDAIFSGIGNQLALYYTERFIASMLYS